MLFPSCLHVVPFLFTCCSLLVYVLFLLLFTCCSFLVYILFLSCLHAVPFLFTCCSLFVCHCCRQCCQCQLLPRVGWCGGCDGVAPIWFHAATSPPTHHPPHPLRRYSKLVCWVRECFSVAAVSRFLVVIAHCTLQSLTPPGELGTPHRASHLMSHSHTTMMQLLQGFYIVTIAHCALHHIRLLITHLTSHNQTTSCFIVSSSDCTVCPEMSSNLRTWLC